MSVAVLLLSSWHVFSTAWHLRMFLYNELCFSKMLHFRKLKAAHVLHGEIHFLAVDVIYC